jgi:sugar phosphate isomerase/epimerase
MGKIEVGLSMLHCLGEPFPSLCKRLQKVTVNHVELVDDGWHALNQRRVRKLREIAESKNLTYTMHAPFANINIATPDRHMRNFVFKRLEKSIAFAQRLECRLVVFHPGLRTGISSFYPGMDWRTNIKSVKRLLNLSKDYGLAVAIENVPEPFGFLVKNVEQFSQFFKELGEELNLTLDIGHSNINGQTTAFIETFGKKIVHIHAHDNDGKHDLHLGIGYGTVDWQQLVADIKTVGFKGIVMVESYQHLEESISKLQQLLA